LRKIDAILDSTSLRRELAPFYNHTGRPLVDPELMIRMLLVGYCYGIRSARRLCQEVHLNLAYRWFCRLGLEGVLRGAWIGFGFPKSGNSSTLYAPAGGTTNNKRDVDVLLPYRGFLWRGRLLARGLRRWIEGILCRLACAEPHCLAGGDFDGLSVLWIPTLTCGPFRHVESAEARNTDRLSSHERIENGVYHGFHCLPCRCLA
jgi:hypothetical protein